EAELETQRVAGLVFEPADVAAAVIAERPVDARTGEEAAAVLPREADRRVERAVLRRHERRHRAVRTDDRARQRHLIVEIERAVQFRGQPQALTAREAETEAIADAVGKIHVVR